MLAYVVHVMHVGNTWSMPRPSSRGGSMIPLGICASCTLTPVRCRRVDTEVEDNVTSSPSTTSPAVSASTFIVLKACQASFLFCFWSKKRAEKSLNHGRLQLPFF